MQLANAYCRFNHGEVCYKRNLENVVYEDSALTCTHVSSHTHSCIHTAPSRLSQLSLPITGSQEFDVETSSIQSGQIGGEFDTISIGSNRSDYPKFCVVKYHYKVCQM